MDIMNRRFGEGLSSHNVDKLRKSINHDTFSKTIVHLYPTFRDDDPVINDEEEPQIVLSSDEEERNIRKKEQEMG